MRSINELLGMPVVAVAEGVRLGRLKGVELDTTEGRVRYLRVQGEHRADGVIGWDAVRAVGPDAITVESVRSLCENILAVDRDRVTPLVGDRPVVTESGKELGRVTGYDVDPATGAVVQYHVAGDGLLARLAGRDQRLPQAAVRAIGRDAIIVDESVLGELRAA